MFFFCFCLFFNKGKVPLRNFATSCCHDNTERSQALSCHLETEANASFGFSNINMLYSTCCFLPSTHVQIITTTTCQTQSQADLHQNKILHLLLYLSQISSCHRGTFPPSVRVKYTWHEQSCECMKSLFVQTCLHPGLKILHHYIKAVYCQCVVELSYVRARQRC